MDLHTRVSGTNGPAYTSQWNKWTCIHESVEQMDLHTRVSGTNGPTYTSQWNKWTYIHESVEYDPDEGIPKFVMVLGRASYYLCK